MIESISITNKAPFFGDEPHTVKARKLNYIFGANGVGKTTISRLIDKPEEYPDGLLRWTGGRKLQTLVLNRDFVEDNFGQLKGIFTLGEDQKETREKIDQARRHLDDEQSKRNRFRRSLSGDDEEGGKEADLEKLEDEFKMTCWAQKKRYEKVFKDAFRGTLNDSEKFKKKVLAQRERNTALLKPYENLIARAETVFGDPPESSADVPAIHSAALLAHESASILSKPVIGKSDVNIAAMIKKLGNSDWVREGRVFYENNNSACPFCQQATNQSFADSLEAYFDETYDADKRIIDDLVSTYETDAKNFQEQVESILSKPGSFVNTEKLEAQKEVLDGLVRENLQTLQGKQTSPSQQVELRSLTDAVGEIKQLIDDARISVRTHNQTVREYKKELETLKAEVWRFVLNELGQDLKTYEGKKKGLEKAIENLKKQIDKTDYEIATKQGEIRDLEKITTNVRSTVDGINSYLEQFGFTSFHLAMSEDEKFYRLVRSDGQEASHTLSEGEKTFVVFLYFYHWLRGSQSETDIKTDRIVVFDDPVSSLDSDVLFIVSTLIRSICEEARENSGNIKQVFVLTHNVYFHREVTFRQGADDKASSDESFWVVCKLASGSIIKAYRENPIKTSYELLWSEVREADPHNPGLGNTMRRILEYYFKVIGGGKLHELHNKFKGTDKLLCHSLLSWANAGSHHILEPDLHVPSDASVHAYQRVFQQIFEKHGHEGHYRMMMRKGANSSDIAIPKNEGMGVEVAPS